MMGGPLTIFVLSTAISISATREPASDTSGAYKALMKATYIQSGMNKQVKTMEKRYIPKVWKEYGGWLAGISKVITDKRVSFEWTF